MIKKLKIAYIVTPITFGGAERVNLNFLKNVDIDRFNIEAILFLRPWEPENFFESELNKLGFTYFSIPVVKSKKIELFRVVRCFLKLFELIRGNSYDLIHTHGYLADLLGVLVSKLCKVPIISTCHGFINEGKKLTFYNKLDCLALKYFDRIISVSVPLKLDLMKKGIFKDKITVITNSPNVSPFADNTYVSRNKLRKDLNVESKEILIGYFGRLSSEKGIIYLLESIKLLNNSIKLVLVGEGPQHEELKEIVDKNKLSSKVKFAGFQKNIDEWFTAIDLFVLPSLTEGTPMVLLEAMSHGVPCIASSVGGIPKIIESGVDGVLISPGRPEEICSAIHCLVGDPDKRNNISKNAKNKVLMKYNINEWVKKIENEYLNILNINNTN